MWNNSSFYNIFGGIIDITRLISDTYKKCSTWNILGNKPIYIYNMANIPPSQKNAQSNQIKIIKILCIAKYKEAANIALCCSRHAIGACAEHLKV
jgi:hypothetical protein